MAYLFSNIYNKNYWNPTNIVEIIVRGWVVSFFETQRTRFCTGQGMDVTLKNCFSIFTNNQKKQERLRTYEHQDWHPTIVITWKKYCKVGAPVAINPIQQND